MRTGIPVRVEREGRYQALDLVELTSAELTRYLGERPDLAVGLVDTLCRQAREGPGGRRVELARCAVLPGAWVVLDGSRALAAEVLGCGPGTFYFRAQDLEDFVGLCVARGLDVVFTALPPVA